jgi:hypothetical protein
MPENCAAIIIAAKHHELTKVKDVRGTTNTIGALRCKFQFRTDDWLHSAKTAMFCNGNAVLHPEIIDDAISVPLDADNECSVPYEVLKDTLPYSIGVWGITDSGLRIVSNWLVFGTQVGSYTEGNAPEDPERTVYEEIVLIAKEATDAAQDVTDRANSGEFDGKSAYELAQEEGFEGTLREWLDSLERKDGYTPVKGVDYVDGKDGYSPIKGVDYFDGKDGYTPIKGVDYVDGKDGYTPVKDVDYFDGYTPIKGVDYVDGKDGYTPVKGKDYFDGEPGYTPIKGVDYFDGAPGKDGYTPVKGVDYFDGQPGAPGKDGHTPYVQDGYWYINGVNTGVKAQGKDGNSINIVDIKESTESGGENIVTFSNGITLTVKNGTDGEDGYTPVKGVDYYTEQDKQTMSNIILEMLKNSVKPAKIGEVTLLADAWAGEGNLYSQVVEIAGVTENSQVDLTPDVQQLAVFYDKDLTFVTENEGGVVTVYAIGQKPTSDYTIQVTITEVEV